MAVLTENELDAMCSDIIRESMEILRTGGVEMFGKKIMLPKIFLEELRSIMLEVKEEYEKILIEFG